MCPHCLELKSNPYHTVMPTPNLQMMLGSPSPNEWRYKCTTAACGAVWLRVSESNEEEIHPVVRWSLLPAPVKANGRVSFFPVGPESERRRA